MRVHVHGSFHNRKVAAKLKKIKNIILMNVGAASTLIKWCFDVIASFLNVKLFTQQGPTTDDR